jgi:hypothetical protein
MSFGFDTVIPLSKFTTWCPYDYGTSLHDQNLKSTDRWSVREGDVVGYFGAHGWFYVYDKATCIRVDNQREQMEKDVKFLEKCKIKGMAVEEAHNKLNSTQ